MNYRQAKKIYGARRGIKGSPRIAHELGIWVWNWNTWIEASRIYWRKRYRRERMSNRCKKLGIPYHVHIPNNCNCTSRAREAADRFLTKKVDNGSKEKAT